MLWPMTIVLTSIHIYPLKSCAPLPREVADVEARGLAGDRRWMVTDTSGNFLTGRQLPRLTLIRALTDGDSLHLAAPDMPKLRVERPLPDAAREPTQVWKDSVEAQLAAPSAHEWISAFLGQQCRIVYMDTNCIRPVAPAYASPKDEVSFADAFPLLLISRAALDHLNGKLATPVNILRFRPNLVVDGTAAHAEDGWKRIRIGTVEFDLVKPCSRCVFTTVDFERGEFAGDGEPLKTLITYRRTPNGVTFGQNLIPRSLGRVCVGDPVSVLE
jgi:uncharacterized protein